MNAGAEGAEIVFWALKMVNFVVAQYMANDDFLNPLDAPIPKAHFHFLPNFGSGSPPGPGGQSR